MLVRIGFSTTDSWISRAIRWVTGAQVSHTYFVYYDECFGQEMVMEADFTGFRLIPYTSFKAANRVVVEITPAGDITAGFQQAAAWLGSSYDYGGLVGMAWVVLGRWLRARWNNPFDSPSKQFCSQAAAFVLKASAYPGAETLIPSTTTPNDLLKFLLVEAD